METLDHETRPFRLREILDQAVALSKDSSAVTGVSPMEPGRGIQRIARSAQRAAHFRGSRIFALVGLLLLGWPAHGFEKLVPLAQPGPWSGVSGLIGYDNRIWFVNSVKYVDHNSADVYSYDPMGGETRYERHLFSQDAGEPVVFRNRLFWPFEDGRFSARRGEYMVTNGRDWAWHMLPDGEVFHIHTMALHRGALLAATSAWRAGLQRSEDGVTWKTVYQHPGPPRSVTRITTLASLGGTLYAGLTAYGHKGGKLLRWKGDRFHLVRAWPQGATVRSLTAHRGWLYGINGDAGGSSLWRTDGLRPEPIEDLKGRNVRDLASGRDALWAITASKTGGALWRSVDGSTWEIVQGFLHSQPLDLYVDAGRVYVGTTGPDGRGMLWGPAHEKERVAHATKTPALEPPAAPSLPDLREELETLDALLADRAMNRDRLLDVLRRLGLAKTPEVGDALADRLHGSFPNTRVRLFGRQLEVSAGNMAQWYLLWALSHNGYGRISPDLLHAEWTQPPNRAEKYLFVPSAAAWAAARLGQADDETIAALLGGLKRTDVPLWVRGDFVGALTALTGYRFAYDIAAWRSWWNQRTSDPRSGGIQIPAGTTRMGSRSLGGTGASTGVRTFTGFYLRSPERRWHTSSLRRKGRRPSAFLPLRALRLRPPERGRTLQQECPPRRTP